LHEYECTWYVSRRRVAFDVVAGVGAGVGSETSAVSKTQFPWPEHSTSGSHFTEQFWGGQKLSAQAVHVAPPQQPTWLSLASQAQVHVPAVVSQVPCAPQVLSSQKFEQSPGGP
jgi:hypothetical protein